MQPGFWILTVTGLGACLGGLAIALFAIAGDQIRRTPRSPRCRRCGYDMESVGTLTCPECGRRHGSAEALLRPRRRWRLGALGLLLALFGAGAIALPFTTPGFWHKWMPTPALILVVPYTTDEPWAASELLRRMNAARAREGEFRVGAARGEWRWEVLAPGLLKTLQTSQSPALTDDIWDALAVESPVAGRAIDSIVPELQTGILRRRAEAAERLMTIAPILADADLRVAFDALEGAAALADAQTAGALNRWADQIRRELDRRADPDARGATLAIERAAADPDALAAALGGSAPADLAALYASMGLGRTSLSAIDLAPGIEGNTAAIHEIHLDGDGRPDRLLTISRPRAPGDWNVLAFLAEGSGWRFAGRASFRGLLVPPELRAVRAGDGRRWLVIRRRSVGAGRRGAVLDSWYRAAAGGLEMVAVADIGGIRAMGPLVCTLQSGEPGVEMLDGRPVARYDTIATARLIFSGMTADGPPAAYSIWVESAPARFALEGEPLEPADAGSPRWVLEGDIHELIAASAQRVVEGSRVLSDEELAYLGAYLRALPDTPEIDAAISRLEAGGLGPSS